VHAWLPLPTDTAQATCRGELTGRLFAIAVRLQQAPYWTHATGGHDAGPRNESMIFCKIVQNHPFG